MGTLVRSLSAVGVSFLALGCMSTEGLSSGGAPAHEDAPRKPAEGPKDGGDAPTAPTGSTSTPPTIQDAFCKTKGTKFCLDFDTRSLPSGAQGGATQVTEDPPAPTGKYLHMHSERNAAISVLPGFVTPSSFYLELRVFLDSIDATGSKFLAFGVGQHAPRRAPSTRRASSRPSSGRTSSCTRTSRSARTRSPSAGRRSPAARSA
jgi:hypothetical protein